MGFAPLAASTLLSGRYKIVGLIRTGGMGATYEGRDLETGRQVAVKQLLDTFHSPLERETGIRNFLAEISVLKSIRHPQIPKLIDHFFIQEKGFFFVLDFVEGRNFSTILEETGRRGLPEETVVRIGIGVCRILQYLHGRSPRPIIHQDIKSSNLMERAADQEVVLVDFGISRAGKPEAGMMIGTPGYAPPEQHLNQVDARSDLYALGATLHELSTGRRPKDFEFPPAHQLRPNLSAEFTEVLEKATRHHPKDRIQDAFVFEEALQGLLFSPVPKPQPDPFPESWERFETDVLIPKLVELQQAYPNEIQTREIPSHCSRYTLTLGFQTPCSLVMALNESRRLLTFHAKEGLLTPRFLGEVSVEAPDAPERLDKIIEKFMKVYAGTRGFDA